MEKRKLRLKLLVPILVLAPMGLGVLFAIVYMAGDIENLPRVLARTDWGYFLLAPLSVPLFYFLHAERISVALRSIGATPPPRRKLVPCLLSGNLINIVIPGMGGELVQAYFVSKFHSLSMPHMLAASAYTKVIGLATNVFLAFMAVWLMSDRGDYGVFSVRNLVQGGLLAAFLAIVLAVAFPDLVKLSSRLMRRVFKLEPPEEDTTKLRKTLWKMADGMDRTAEHFKQLRRGGVWVAAKIVGITLLCNVAFSSALLLGFVAIGYVPELHLLFLFYSILTLVMLSAMIFMGGLAVSELAAVTYWSYLTGLSISEILVALLAVKAWQLAEATAAGLVLWRYLARLSSSEAASLFKKKIPPAEGNSESSL